MWTTDDFRCYGVFLGIRGGPGSEERTLMRGFFFLFFRQCFGSPSLGVAMGGGVFSASGLWGVAWITMA